MPDHASKRGFTRRTRPRVFRILAIFAGVLVALVLAVLVFLHSPPGREYVTSQITQLLKSEQIDLATDALEYNLLHLSLGVGNLRVRSARAPDAPTFAVVSKATLDLSLIQLLRGRYVVESGTADGVEIHYFVDEGGQDNLPMPVRKADEPTEPLDYLIDDLTITNARVRYENRARDIDLALPLSTLTMDGNPLTDRHDIQLEGAAGTARLQQHLTSIDRMTGSIDLGDGDLTVKRLDVATDGGDFALSGLLADFDKQPTADLTLHARIDAAKTARVMHWREDVSGTIEIDATAKGDLRAPALQARINGSDVRYRNFDRARLHADAAYDLNARRARLSALDVRSPLGNITGHGVLNLAESDTSELFATMSGVDVRTVMEAFDVPYVVASRLDARVQARWRGLDYLGASGSANAALTPTQSMATKSALPIGGRVDVTAGQGRITAALNGVRAAGAVIAGRIAIRDRHQLTGELRTRISDVGSSISTAEAFLGRRRGSLMPVRASGPLDAAARVTGSVRSPLVAVHLNAPALGVENATGLSLTGDISYTGTTLDIPAIDIAWNEARARTAGRIGLTGSQRIDLTLDAERLEIPHLLRAANQTDVSAAGTAGLHARAQGTVARPVVTSTLQVTDLVAYNEVLGNLDGEIGLVGSEVRVTTLVLNKPQPDGNGQLAATGTYDIDRRSYRFDLRSTNLQLLSATLPDGRSLRGRISLDAKGTGTTRAPAATVKASVDALQIGDYQLGIVSAAAHVADQQATVTASADQFSLEARATIGVESPYRATIRADVRDLDLARLPLNLETPIAGHLRASVEAAGDLAAPEQGRATATVQQFTGSWNGQPFSLGTPAVIEYQQERLRTDRFQLSAQDSTLTIGGALPLTERAGEGLLNLEARANLATLVGYAPSDIALDGDGAVGLTGTIRGTLKAIDPDVVITAQNASLGTRDIQPGLSNLELRARVADGEANIERLSANWGPARIDATGQVPLEVVPQLPVDIPRRGGPATFTARVRDLEIASLPGVPEAFAGRIALDAQLQADRASLAAVQGTITFPELQLALSGLTLAQQQPSSIEIAAGTARIERFDLSGTAGTIGARGTIGLEEPRALDVRADGKLNIGAVTVFTDAIRAEGQSNVQLAAGGTVSSPEFHGSLTVADATIVSDDPRIAAESVNARVDLEGTRIVLSSLTADVNGGTVDGGGTVTLGEGGISDVNLQLEAHDVAFDAPLDLRSLSDANVRLTRKGDEFLVDGQITVTEAGLTDDIKFDRGLLASLAERRSLDLTEGRNPFLDRLRFDLNVDTAAPILIDNNIAKAEVTTDLRVLGSPYETGLAGQLTVLEGGELTLNEHRYHVQRGVLTFTDERRIVPSFDLSLATTTGNYDITVTVTGPPGETETRLTSDPELPETDILAMLVTGRTLEEMRGEEFEVAREQVLSYMTGRVGSRLGRGVEKATGLSEVRIEPNLIANEADPSARLTVGQDLTDDLKLVYSTNLTDSNDQIWVAEYDITRRFQARAVRQSDNSYRMDFRHDVRFGGRPAPRRLERERLPVLSVEIVGDAAPVEPIAKLFRIQAGEDFDFFRARRGLQRIEQFYTERDRLQARVRLDREFDETGVKLKVRVTRGPRVTLRFDGAAPPSGVQKEVRAKWHRGVFDTQRAGDGAEVLRAWLMRSEHLQARVTSAIEDMTADERVVAFRIEPGPRYGKVILAFDGADGIDPRELDSVIDDQDLEQQLFTDARTVTELLERYYREQGYLVAEVSGPSYEYSQDIARVVLSISEGPRFVVRDVTTTGNSVFDTRLLVGELPVVAGDPFLPAAAENALQKIRGVYWRRGYNDVRPDYALALDRRTGQVDVKFSIKEGPQSVVAEIAVEGNEKTSDRLVREQVELEPERPLDLTALSRSRRNLYDIGAFSVVDVTREELGGDFPTSAAGTAAQTADAAVDQKPVRVNVSVREVQPIQLRYGASYDTERGVGGVMDISNHNSLGNAREVGLRSRYDGQLREARLYLTQPSLRYWPIELTASLFYRDERNPRTEITNPFNIDRRGMSVQGETRLRDSYVWSYGFRYERAHTFDPSPLGALDRRATVSPLTSTFTRETRDEILDATTGSFLSQAFAYSPSWLGSDLPFVKYFGQYFHYIPLQAPRRKPFTNEILRPRIVYAAGVRLGLARGMGDIVPESERFFAGGSTTLRGFAQNAVGPIGVDRLPTGGTALLVINNELRFPLVSIVDGVVFSDIGNVYARIADFSLTDLRKSAGVGLRFRTPWFLVRGDYGLVLDHRPGERRSRFYFSIGQAF